MKANQQTLLALEAEHQALRDMFQDSQIEAPVYGKGLLKLAAEYMAVQEPRLAQKILQGLGEHYIAQDLPQHLATDTVFGQAVEFLCRELVQNGWVSLDDQQFNFPFPPPRA